MDDLSTHSPGPQFNFESMVDAFEEALRRPGPVEIESFLSTSGAQRRLLLHELICIEVAYRQSRGEAVAVEDYLTRFPELSESPSFVASLRRSTQPALSGPPTRLHGGGRAGRATELQPGAVLGNYVIRAKIGQGGMGTVYQAEHRLLRRLVALKVLSPALTDVPGALARFRNEIRMQASVRHPNLVIAFDADESAGTCFLAMEYVEGCDLQAYVQKHGPLPVNEALRYLVQAARGLAAAHKHGIVHRDVKPGNLLRENSGEIKLLDLGLARVAGEVGPSALASIAGLTEAGHFLGTPDFIAPEQIDSPSQVDARADLYSLGCTLWFLLTGEVVYPGGSLMAKVVAHRDKPPPALMSKRPDVPPAVAALFSKLVSKSPQHRYASADELIRELEKLLSPDQTPTKRRGVRSQRAHGNQRGWALVLAGLSLAALITLLIFNLSSPWQETGIRLAAREGAHDQTQARIEPQRSPPHPRPFSREGRSEPEREPAPATDTAFPLSGNQPDPIPSAASLAESRIPVIEHSSEHEVPEVATADPPKTTPPEAPPLPQPAEPPVADAGAGQAPRPVIDLLRTLSPARDAITGIWQLGPKGLQAPVEPRSLLRVPVELPDQYSLTLDVQRTTGGPLGLCLGVRVAGRSALIAVEGAGPTERTGLELLDGESVSTNETAFPGPIDSGKQLTLQLVVSGPRVRLSCRDHVLFDWRGTPERLNGIPSEWRPEGEPALFLGASSPFLLTRFELGSSSLPTDEALATEGAQSEVATWLSARHGTGCTVNGRLTSLGLGPNVTLSGPDVQRLVSLNSLQRLRLHSCTLLDDASEPFARLTSITHLDLAGTPLSPTMLRSVGQLSHIRELVLTGCDVHDSGLALLEPLREICLVVLDSNPLDGSGFEALTRWPQLQAMTLNETKIDDRALLAISQIATLTTLQFSQTSVTDAGIQLLERLPRLRAVAVSPRMTNAGLASLTRHRGLQRLSLAGTQITDAGLPELENLKQLKFLDLSETRITTAAVRPISHLISLKTLRIGGTRLGEADKRELRDNLAGCQVVD